MEDVLYGYHATDACNIKSIKTEGFKWTHNNTHWLGDGAYFFLDPALAKKWGDDVVKGIIKKYGNIKDISFLRVKICTKKNFCDMRLLSDYNSVTEEFQNFFNIICKKNLKLTFLMKNEENKDIREKIRCAFFNYLASKKNLNGIIAFFIERKLSEVDLKDNRDNSIIFSQFKMPYIECQVCVYNNNIIQEIETIDLE